MSIGNLPGGSPVHRPVVCVLVVDGSLNFSQIRARSLPHFRVPPARNMCFQVVEEKWTQTYRLFRAGLEVPTPASTEENVSTVSVL